MLQIETNGNRTARLIRKNRKERKEAVRVFCIDGHHNEARPLWRLLTYLSQGMESNSYRQYSSALASFKTESGEIESPLALGGEIDGMATGETFNARRCLVPAGIRRTRDGTDHRAIHGIDMHFELALEVTADLAAKNSLRTLKGKIFVSHRCAVAEVGDIRACRSHATGIDFLRDYGVIGRKLQIPPIVNRAMGTDQMATDACRVNTPAWQRCPVESAARDFNLLD